MGSRLILVWILIFAGLTLVLGPSLKPFRDPLYLGHQFREIVTHGSITLCLTMASMFSVELGLFHHESEKRKNGMIKESGLFLIGAVLVPLFIVYQLRSTDIMSYAQKKTGYVDLLASHNFEHMIDYIFVMLLSATLYIHVRTSGRNSANAPRKCTA